MARHEPIKGGYVYLTVQGIEYRVYYEEAGQGIPYLLGHSAGSDGRQYRHVLCDEEVTKNFRCIAYDMPYHGKSFPPHGVNWWEKEYNLSKSFMLEFPRVFAQAFELDRPVYMGTSMGGHLAIDLALHDPDNYRATIAVQGSLQSQKKYRDLGMEAIRKEYDNPNVSRNSIGAAMKLNFSPYSPEPNTREMAWTYQTSGPGIFAGDLYYYYVGHNVSPEEAATIDTNKCMLYLLTGEYDSNTAPADTKMVADLVKGSKFWAMEKLGHFPHMEDYPRFREYLMPILSEIKAKS
jgi:pimeloyl-ACP methyl ester carboxylesterase